MDKPKVILATNVPRPRSPCRACGWWWTRPDPARRLQPLQRAERPGHAAGQPGRHDPAGRPRRREAPGSCLRLCSARSTTAACVLTRRAGAADLAGALLQALAAGFGDLGALPWLQARRPAMWTRPGKCARVGRMDPEGGLTPKGRPWRARRCTPAWRPWPGRPAQAAEIAIATDELPGAAERGAHQGAGFLDRAQALRTHGRVAPAAASAGGLAERGKGAALGQPGTLGAAPGHRHGPAFPEQVAYSRHGTDRRGETRFVLAGGSEASCRSDSQGFAAGWYLLVEVVESRPWRRRGPAARDQPAAHPARLAAAGPAPAGEGGGGRLLGPRRQAVQARERMVYGVGPG